MTPARALPAPHPRLHEDHILGMAEMGFAGLSEQWLMRRAGDLHWRLIAQAMGQRRAVFTCAQGQPLYAAFCATSLRLRATPDLGDTLSLSGTLGQLGHGRLASVQQIEAGGRRIGRIILISVFVGRTDPACNHGIVRRAPRMMALPAPAPRVAQKLAQHAARIARARPVIDGPRTRLLPCPALDFNAARLMYFPSFAALSERADFALGAPHARRIVARDVVYQGNVAPGEEVEATLCRQPARTLCQLATPDGRPLALMRSRYIAI
ncbi:MAG: Pnap_2097 family protein [Paracoccus sp. (in: a-proteobacteria)]|uniref:Pnap_2097 family protein n=1 Tax=Paracoccus sp. TaxID=267 RepID=UPI00391D2CE7